MTLFVSCSRDDYCPADARRCTPRKATGSNCTSSNECIGYACSGGRCVVNGGVANATTCKVAGGS